MYALVSTPKMASTLARSRAGCTPTTCSSSASRGKRSRAAIAFPSEVCPASAGKRPRAWGDLPERDKFPDQGGRAFPTMRSHVRTVPEVVRELPRANKARKAFAKLKNESAGCSGDLRFLLVGGEDSRRRPATGRAVRPLGGLGWRMRLRLPWLGIVASFREDDLFEGEICQKSGGFHHLGKNSSEEGKVAPSPLPKKRTRNKSPG